MKKKEKKKKKSAQFLTRSFE